MLSSNQYTVLTDRYLWYDGESSYRPEHAGNALYDNAIGNIPVTELTDELRRFNDMVPESKFRVKTELMELQTKWQESIPIMEKDDLLQILAHEIATYIAERPESDADGVIDRVQQEMAVFEQLGMLPLISAIFWIVNTLHNNGVVTGVGRGSSVASFVLFLLRVHDIDSYEYNLDFDEFVRIN